MFFSFQFDDNLPPRLAWLLLAGQKPDTKRKTLLKTISIPRISNFFSTYKIFGLIFLNAIAHKSRRGRSGDNMNICVFLRMRMGD